MNKKRKNQGSLSKESESMKSPLELVNNDNFCNNMNMNFPPLFESSFGNNNFNNEANYDILPFHENYLLKNEDEYSFNIMPLNLLEQKIENYQIDYECQKNENNTDIDKQLKGFIDNLFDNSTKDNEPNFCNNCERLEKAFDNNNNNITNNALISTIQQIEELEKILKETRVELLKKSFDCHR